jgi:hypothetical protein
MRISRILQTSLMLAGLAALPTFAQTGDAGTGGTGTGATGTGGTGYPNSTTTYPQQDRGREHNYGWIGLIGLAGLAGFARRGHHDHVDRNTTGVRGTDRV